MRVLLDVAEGFERGEDAVDIAGKQFGFGGQFGDAHGGVIPKGSQQPTYLHDRGGGLHGAKSILGADATRIKPHFKYFELESRGRAISPAAGGREVVVAAHIRQPEIATLVEVGEALVVQSQQRRSEERRVGKESRCRWA